MSDLAKLFSTQDKSARWKAERENASARYELARIDEHCAYLISQHEPLNTIGIDRERLRIVFSYIKHGNINRLNRELKGGNNDPENSNIGN